MKIKVAIVLFFTFCCSSSCELIFPDKALPLYIDNQSSDPIAAYVSKIYPDTSISTGSEFIFDIPPMGRGQTIVGTNSDRWKDIFSRLPKDTLSVFLFSSDTLLKYTWPEIKSGYKILKRYDLSLADIEGMNGILTYP